MFDYIFQSIFFLAICHIVVLLIIVILFIIVLYKLVFRKRGLNRKEKIIAVGISSLIFSKTIHNAVVVPISQLIGNLQRLFYLFQVYAEADENNELKEKIIKEGSPKIDVSIIEAFQNFPLAAMFAYFAVCVIIYLLVLLMEKKIVVGDLAITNFNFTFFSNIFICALLVFSLFLVISVFIAIPYFNKMSQPTVFTKARMDSVLSNMSTPERDTFTLAGLLPNPFAKDSVQADILKGETLKRFSSMKDKTEITRSMEDLQREYNRFASYRERAVSALTDFAKDYRKKEIEFKNKLSVNFDSKSYSLLTDKADLFMSTRSAFEYFIDASKETFSNEIKNINTIDQLNVSELKEVVQDIEKDIQALAETEAVQPTNDSLPKPRLILNSTYNPVSFVNYPTLISSAYNTAYVPTIEKDGSDWPLFGAISKYLIRTQSTELVLLIGMFGFGLLGASILSFEKLNGPKEFLTTSIIKNFVNVLARGFGAALVVYMAIKAGLTIFTAGTTTDANGYMLLLTCFAAAIFSDKIWEKLKGWVEK